MFSEALLSSARALLEKAGEKNLRIVTAESCTGGLVSALFTEIPGSSDTFERGFVVYSNRAKTEMLDVPAPLLAEHGAVSEEVARAMAGGALVRSGADLSVAVTGIAGPGGGGPQKPVGLVHLAAARRNGELLHREFRFGDIGRGAVRLASVAEALKLLGGLL